MQTRGEVNVHQAVRLANQPQMVFPSVLCVYYAVCGELLLTPKSNRYLCLCIGTFVLGLILPDLIALTEASLHQIENIVCTDMRKYGCQARIDNDVCALVVDLSHVGYLQLQCVLCSVYKLAQTTQVNHIRCHFFAEVG